MDLLPSSHTEFSQPDYWDRFFKKRGKIPFEWYGEYADLCVVLHKYISPSNHVLVVGCGNSALSQDMYDNGLQHLANIDISDVVVRQMSDRHRDKRPKMTFERMDVTQMSYEDGQFHVVLDKGTLDALMVSEESQVVDTVQQMFAQVARCLRVTGRYVVISLLQNHVQKILLDYFTALGWPVRIHRVSTGGGEDSGSLSMPVFAVVLTKLRPMANMPQIVEVCRFEDRIDRLESLQYLTEIIRDMQYYHVVRQQLRKRLSTDQQLSLELHSRELDTPRYTLTVVDAPQAMDNTFAIFIVPQGRETEWLFSTDKGRLTLQASAGYQRLVVVTLTRGHHYDNLEAIKAELSGKVMELAPPGCTGGKVQTPFLSIGEDIGKCREIVRGDSEVSGGYLVEDVEMNGGQVYRRLVFLNNKNVVQSEAHMVPAGRKKKKRRQGSEAVPESLRVDKGYLSCAYQTAVVGGLAFLPSLDESICGVLVGLGGANLPSFLHSLLPQLTLDLVELDPTVVDVASKWFEFKPDHRLRVHVAEGLHFIRDLISAGEQRDLVIIDVDSKDASVGVSCPPLAFVEAEALASVSQLLSPQGVFILNLACRDESIGHSILERVKNSFASCAYVKLEEEINIIVFAGRSGPMASWSGQAVRAQGERLSGQILSVWPNSPVSLTDTLDSIKFSQEE